MRITSNILVNNMMKHLQGNMNDLDELNQQLASGKQFQIPSDAPIKVTNSMQFNSLLSDNKQYTRNVEQTRNWINTSESSLADGLKVMQRLRELAVRGANGSLSQTDRTNLAEEVKELKDELVNIGNSRLGDRYLFGGQATSTPPLDDDGIYQGDHNRIEREINPAIKMPINVIGEEIFSPAVEYAADLEDNLRQRASLKGDQVQDFNGSFKLRIDGGSELEIDIDDIKDDLDGPTDINIVREIDKQLGDEGRALLSHDGRLIIKSATAGENSQVEITDVNTANASDLGLEAGDSVLGTEGTDKIGDDNIRNVDQAIESFVTKRAELGARINRLDLVEGRLDDEILNLEKLKSENEDVDLAEAITDLKMEESVYRASLSVGARIMQPSLVDFIR